MFINLLFFIQSSLFFLPPLFFFHLLRTHSDNQGNVIRSEHPLGKISFRKKKGQMLTRLNRLNESFFFFYLSLTLSTINTNTHTKFIYFLYTHCNTLFTLYHSPFPPLFHVYLDFTWQEIFCICNLGVE